MARDYSTYKGGGRKKSESSWANIGPALDDYEKTLRDNPGSGQGGSWLAKFAQTIPLPGVAIAARHPLVESILGPVEQPINKILEEGEDAPVVGPAIGATGRLFDILSRGNYAGANFAEALQGENLAPDPNQGFLDKLAKIWQVGATIPAAALPFDLGERLTGASNENFGEALQAAGQGLWGTKKNNFGEVLEKGGVEGDLAAAAAFGMDVALDPTSYVGTGVVKGLNPGEEIIDTIRRTAGVGTSPPGMSSFDNLKLNLPPGVDDLAETVSKGKSSPVEEVVAGPATDLSTGGKVGVQDLGGDPTKPSVDIFTGFKAADDVEMETIVSPFGTITRPKKNIDVSKVVSAEDAKAVLEDTPLADVAPGDLGKWMKAFDKDTPAAIKKGFEPEEGVEYLTKTTDEEMAVLAEKPPATAGEDWDLAKEAYLPDGPVEIPIEKLATDPIEGLIKAPFEVPGPIQHGGDIPMHRDFLNKSYDGERLAQPARINVDATLPGFDDIPPAWRGNGFDLGKVPVRRAGEGYVALRVAGTDVYRSYKAYNLGRKVLEPFLYGTGASRTLAKTFSMNAHLPDGMDQALRVAQNVRMTDLDKNFRAVTNHIGKLTLDERRMLTLAVDEGKNLSNVIPSYVDETFQTMEDYRQLIKGIHNSLHTAEDAHGLVGKRMDNYVKRIVKEDPKKLANLRKKDGSFTYTLQELADKGVVMETDIAELLRDRVATSARNLIRADVEHEALMRFGVPKKVIDRHPELVEKFDLVEWKATSKRTPKLGHMIPRRHQEGLEWFDQVTLKDAESAKLGHLIDSAVSEWKYFALLTPGRHIRDTIGDIVMNAQAGVMNALSYAKATKVLGWARDADANTALGRAVPLPNSNVRKLQEADIVGMAKGIPGLKPDVGTISINKQRIPIDTVWNDIYVQSGAKSGQMSTEVQRMTSVIKGTGERSVVNPLHWNDTLKRNVGKASDAREDWARITHVIDYMDRNMKGPILNKDGSLTLEARDTAKRAGESVRKWNIDYGNLTPFEKNTARRWIPFYTFMRHNIPRQLELLFTKPGFMALYPKSNNLMQGAFGTDNGDDHLLPPWVRETAPFRIQLQKQEQKGAMGWLLDKFGVEPGMQVLGDPNTSLTPIGDVARLNALFDPVNPLKASLQEAGSMVTPAFKIPAELAFGTTIFNGAPIEGGYYKYFANQLPQTRGAYGQDDAGIMRMLTGLPIRPITPKMQENEAYRRELEAKRLFKESMSRNLPAQYRGMDPTKQREIYRNFARATDGSP